MKINYKIQYKKVPVEGEFFAGLNITTINHVIKLLRDWLQRNDKKFNPMLVGAVTVTVTGDKSEAMVKFTGMCSISPDIKLTWKELK